MEQAKALQGLLDAADLTKMVEEMTRPGSLEALSTSALAGLRLTLSHIRGQILLSHDALAAQWVQDSRRGEPASIELEETVSQEGMNGKPSINNTILSSGGAPRVNRQTLRASLERMIEG